MSRKKVLVYTANRSEYSRLLTVMEAVREHPDLELQLVVGGSHLLDRYGQTLRDIERDGFTIAEKVATVLEGTSPETMAKSAGLSIIELTTCFKRLAPDVLLVIGDRYDMFPAVLTASYLNIPIAHIQGGEKTGTIDESIRHAATKFSHLHFPATEQGREFIIRMGEDPERVFMTGCPSIDVLLRVPVLDRETLFTMPPLPATIRSDAPVADQPYILCIQHPVTTEYGDSYQQMYATLEALHRLKTQVLLVYPNLDAGSDDMIAAIRHFELRNKDSAWLHCYKHIPMDVFVNLMRHASCMVGNSSAGIRESCYFGLPTVNVGTRQNNRTRGENVVNVGHEAEAIERAVRTQIEHGPYTVEHVYGSGSAGTKIADLLSRVDVKVQK
ncbi:MAG: UDP-N-acetylglucosamine 2-epimerase [Desulfovibrionaceae bacterium]